ncbi:MAG: preprotein translocase subunit YajC [Rikenellaceae bacterium]
MSLMTIIMQAAAPAQGSGGTSMLLMMALIFGVMYFLMIRPQQKRQKELNKFRSELKKGDKVVTAGGIYGTVKGVKGGEIHLEVDTNVTIRVDMSMIMRDTTDVQSQQQAK